MNSIKRTLLIGATVIGMGSAAFAGHGDHAKGSGTEQSAASMHKHHDGKFKERMAQRQADLRDKLKLTAAQEPAWKTYVAAMTPPIAAHVRIVLSGKKLTAPERMERKLAKSKQRQDKMAARLAATKTFYAVLSPEQQKVFNDNFGHRGMGQHHGRRGGH